jgi:hypothetical protein
MNKADDPLSIFAKNISSSGLAHYSILNKIGEDYIKDGKYTKEAGEIFTKAALVLSQQQRLSDERALELMKLFMESEEIWKEEIKNNKISTNEINSLLMHFPVYLISWLSDKVKKTDDLSKINPDDWYCD